MNKQALEKNIHNNIPISQFIGFRVLELGSAFIKVSGGSKENINIHGTAFAGSQYSICTLAAWGLIYSRLPKRTSLIMVNGKIEYLTPVHGEIIAFCRLQENKLTGFLERLHADCRIRIDLSVRVGCLNTPAAQFSATLQAKLK